MSSPKTTEQPLSLSAAHDGICLAERWDGPHFRPHIWVETTRAEKGLETDFVMNAGRQDVVWMHLLAGSLVYERPQVPSRRITRGDTLFVIQPHQGRLVRPADGLPCRFLIGQLTDSATVDLSEKLIQKYGVLFHLKSSAPPVTLARAMARRVRECPLRSPHEWSVLAYHWFMTWIDTIEKNQCSLADTGALPSRVLPLQQGTLRDYAHRIGYSASHVSRKLKSMWGVTPGEILRKGRAEEAARLLRTTNLKVREIAGKVGYKSGSAFNHAFVREHGMTPLAYRHQSR